jgi:peptide chain release factor subunit 1
VVEPERCGGWLAYHPGIPQISDDPPGGAVAVITESAIRELAAIRGERSPITSCYLDVDGRRLARYPDLEHEVDLILKDARVRANGEQSVHDDLVRIGRLVRGGIDRSRTRGLAIFACSDLDLWEVIELPVPVHSQVVINHVPAVGQLESVLKEHEPIGVLLVDRQRAEMYVFELGELVGHSEHFDDLTRDEGPRGQSDRGGGQAHQVDARVQQHLRNAAKVAFEVWQEHEFSHLVVGAPEHLATELTTHLHPYLVARLAPQRVNVAVGAGHDQVLAAAQAVETEIERRREAALVGRLRDAAASGGRAVLGLPGVLDALGTKRVDQLVVSRGFSAPGWRCDGCDCHVAVGRLCKRCGEEMVEVDDIVEEAVEAALAQSCRVEICVDNADLDVMGRIGAFLRY